MSWLFHKIDIADAEARIKAIEFRCVDEIRVRYLAHVFELNEPVPSEEEYLQAHFDGANIFYFVGNGQMAWREVSKELALLVCPGLRAPIDGCFHQRSVSLIKSA